MAGSVKINDRLYFDDPNNPCTEAKAFVPTNSNNGNILVSLNESNVPGSIQSVFAGVRTNQNNQTGILVSVFFSQKVTPGTSVVLLTVQQDGGVVYGPSEPFIA